jgi:hypothetical protein
MSKIVQKPGLNNFSTFERVATCNPISCYTSHDLFLARLPGKHMDSQDYHLLQLTNLCKRHPSMKLNHGKNNFSHSFAAGDFKKKIDSRRVMCEPAPIF